MGWLRSNPCKLWIRHVWILGNRAIYRYYQSGFRNFWCSLAEKIGQFDRKFAAAGISQITAMGEILAHHASIIVTPYYWATRILYGAPSTTVIHSREFRPDKRFIMLCELRFIWRKSFVSLKRSPWNISTADWIFWVGPKNERSSLAI